MTNVEQKGAGSVDEYWSPLDDYLKRISILSFCVSTQDNQKKNHNKAGSVHIDTLITCEIRHIYDIGNPLRTNTSSIQNITHVQLKSII